VLRVCVLLCCAECCSVLQCVASPRVPAPRSVYCSMIQCVAVCCSVLQCVAVCCRMLQSVAECCSMLQCVAVCRSVLQCVAVCCRTLQPSLTVIIVKFIAGKDSNASAIYRRCHLCSPIHTLCVCVCVFVCACVFGCVCAVCAYVRACARIYYVCLCVRLPMMPTLLPHPHLVCV
jgi:hypothetical protein